MGSSNPDKWELPQDWKDIFVEYEAGDRSDAWLYQQIEAHSRRAAPSATLPKVPRVSLAVDVKELRAEGWGSRDAVIQLAEAYLALSDGHG